MKLYLHLYEKGNPTSFETGIFDFKKQNATLQDLFKEVAKVIPGVLISFTTTYMIGQKA